MVVEEWLVAKAKNGNKNAFEEIYTIIYKDLYRYAYYMLGNREDATDIVSDTVIDIYKGIDKLKNDNSFVSWCFKILSNKCRMKCKEYILSKQCVTNISDNVKATEGNDYINGMPESEPEAYIKSFENNTHQRIDILNALRNISEEEKEIIILSAIYGYNSKEIGNIMSLKPNTVRSKLDRALQKMKERMTAYEL